MSNLRLTSSELAPEVEAAYGNGTVPIAGQKDNELHVGCLIDYLIQTRYSLFVVEISFSRSELTLPVVQEVKRKIDALITPKNLSVRPVLVHVNGVAEAVENTDYFDKVLDFGPGGLKMDEKSVQSCQIIIALAPRRTGLSDAAHMSCDVISA
jgi:hypothetical protein